MKTQFRSEKMTEDQEIAVGEMLIEVLRLKLKKNGRVDTTWGDKTPLGLFRTIDAIVNGRLD